MPDPIILDTSNAVSVANTNFSDLTSDTTFTLPSINLEDGSYELPSKEDNVLYGEISKISNSDLTTKEPNGSGIFDELMTSVKAHLQTEYDKGRITGDQYSKTYISLTTSAMSTAVQFLLTKESTYWNNLLVQHQARKSEIDVVLSSVILQNSKADLITSQYNAKNAEAEYALTKLRLSTENAQFSNITAQIRNSLYNVENILPKQNDLLVQDIAIKTYQHNDIMPVQKTLLQEQVEVQHAQTSDFRVDGVTPITGSVGKQKELYTQQITSYKRDSEYKTAKMFLDGWITQKTLDEGLLAPAQLTNINIDSVLSTIRTNNDL